MKQLSAIIIIAGMISAAGYFAYQAVKAPAEPPVAGSSVSVFAGAASAPEPKSGVAETAEKEPAARSAPEGALEYRNELYGFSLFYPAELLVTEHSEGGDAATVTFQNVETAQGFQIFIVPYGEAQVSEQRFKMDVPSGVRKNLTETAVDGAVGAAFESFNAELGETSEIWFIRNGFLYEVTTLKPLDQWLKEIMQSWKWEK